MPILLSHVCVVRVLQSELRNDRKNALQGLDNMRGVDHRNSHLLGARRRCLLLGGLLRPVEVIAGAPNHECQHIDTKHDQVRHSTLPGRVQRSTTATHKRFATSTLCALCRPVCAGLRLRGLQRGGFRPRLFGHPAGGSSRAPPLFATLFYI